MEIGVQVTTSAACRWPQINSRQAAGNSLSRSKTLFVNILTVYTVALECGV